MRIGIIGAGVSGMTAAWMLQDDHEVTLIERSLRPGGHVETVPVVVGGATVHAELGARFFFDESYPYFLALLRVLAVPLRWNDARCSFTNVLTRHTVVLPPRSPRELAALLRSPRLALHFLSLHRLIAEQPAVAARRDFSIAFRRHLAERGYPPAFGPEFAFPFLAACWGAPLSLLPDFPVYSLLKGMPSGRRPGFHEIEGGMSRYVDAFARELARVDVRLGATVQRIDRREAFHVETTNGDRFRFDRLIVATSARDAARLLGDVPGAAAMQAAVSSFRHFETHIVVHGDPSLLPPRRTDWAHTNLFFDGDAAWMSDWPGLRRGAPVFRTWLREGRALPEPLYARRRYHHLVMSPANAVLQRRIARLQGEAGLWVTGMYAVDVDNHESALLSAVPPVRVLSPSAPNLARLLAAVVPGATHGLDVLPAPEPESRPKPHRPMEGLR